MTRVKYLKEVARLWTESRPPPALTRSEYLKKLAAMAGALPPAQGVSPADLDRFRDLIMKRPDDLRRRLLGANVQRRRALNGEQREALDALDTWPDLLSPLGELRYEPSHSRLLARFINPRVEPRLGPKLLEAFIALAGASKESLEPADLAAATVEAERFDAEAGRMDIWIELPKALVIVEAKVDADEGVGQLADYYRALEKHRGAREGILVYLTLPGTDAPKSRVPFTSVTFDQVLTRWLPYATGTHGAAGYLGRYLKSVALVLGCCGKRAFDDWTTAQQRAALEIVEQLGEA